MIVLFALYPQFLSLAGTKNNTFSVFLNFYNTIPNDRTHTDKHFLLADVKRIFFTHLSICQKHFTPCTI